nr:MAG TPA: hypothetical protein [Caudoviricetes sp.]
MASSLDILKQILDREMEMPKNRIWAYNANIDLPKDNNLFIILSYGERTPYSNTIKYKNTANGLEEVQSMSVKEDVIISLLSKSTQARDRAHEVLFALNSTYSKTLQQQNKIHITNIGEVYDASFLEATSRINRFDVRCSIFKAYTKSKSVDYYDKYSFEVWTGEPNGSVKDKFEV